MHMIKYKRSLKSRKPKPQVIRKVNKNPWKTHPELKMAGEPLGNGSFGKIWKARHKTDGQLFAIKKISLSKAIKHLKDRSKVLNEVKLQSQIKSEFVVQYYNSWIENAHKPYEVFSSSEREIDFSELSSTAQLLETQFLFIQLELCDGDLEKLLQSNSNTTNNFTYQKEEEIRKLFIQLAKGVDAIHEAKIVHCDIKPANIFYKVQPDGNIIWKIGDLGLGIPVKEELESFTSKRGTIAYRSPEMIRNKSKASNKTDIFSLGLVYLKILLFTQNVDDIDIRSLFFDLQYFPQNEQLINEALENCKFKGFKGLIMRMLSHDPDVRPSAKEIHLNKQLSCTKLTGGHTKSQSLLPVIAVSTVLPDVVQPETAIVVKHKKSPVSCSLNKKAPVTANVIEYQKPETSPISSKHQKPSKSALKKDHQSVSKAKKTEKPQVKNRVNFDEKNKTVKVFITDMDDSGNSDDSENSEQLNRFDSAVAATNGELQQMKKFFRDAKEMLSTYQDNPIGLMMSSFFLMPYWYTKCLEYSMIPITAVSKLLPNDAARIENKNSNGAASSKQNRNRRPFIRYA